MYRSACLVARKAGLRGSGWHGRHAALVAPCAVGVVLHPRRRPCAIRLRRTQLARFPEKVYGRRCARRLVWFPAYDPLSFCDTLKRSLGDVAGRCEGRVTPHVRRERCQLLPEAAHRGVFSRRASTTAAQKCRVQALLSGGMSDEKNLRCLHRLPFEPPSHAIADPVAVPSPCCSAHTAVLCISAALAQSTRTLLAQWARSRIHAPFPPRLLHAPSTPCPTPHCITLQHFAERFSILLAANGRPRSRGRARKSDCSPP